MLDPRSWTLAADGPWWGTWTEGVQVPGSFVTDWDAAAEPEVRRGRGRKPDALLTLGQQREVVTRRRLEANLESSTCEVERLKIENGLLRGGNLRLIAEAERASTGLAGLASSAASGLLSAVDAAVEASIERFLPSELVRNLNGQLEATRGS